MARDRSERRYPRGLMMRKGVFVVFLAALLCATPAIADETTPLASGANSNITGPNGVCKKVTNGTARTLAVTTYNSAEWVSFYTSPPSGVTIAACGGAPCNVPWGGTVPDGVCLTAYTATIIYYSADCQTCGDYAQSRCCANGVLSGNFPFGSCDTVYDSEYCW